MTQTINDRIQNSLKAAGLRHARVKFDKFDKFQYPQYTKYIYPLFIPMAEFYDRGDFFNRDYVLKKLKKAKETIDERIKLDNVEVHFLLTALYDHFYDGCTIQCEVRYKKEEE